MVSKTEILRRLAYQPAKADHNEAYRTQVLSDTNDRGACILMTANLENALDAALEAVLHIDHESRRELFGEAGPLGTLSQKASMAYALGIIGQTTRKNLRIIRIVRNAFAHAKIPIEFSTPEVSAVCDDLTLINPLRPNQSREHDLAALTPRLVFSDVCAATTHLFYRYSLGAILLIDPKALKSEVGSYPDYDLFLKLKPLPCFRRPGLPFAGAAEMVDRLFIAESRSLCRANATAPAQRSPVT
jgi:DNA-binding MltR family transcriptional regulator